MADPSLKVPLLILVDDHHGDHTENLVEHAKAQGIDVRKFKSTHDAQYFITHNLEFLRKHNTGAPKNVRLITDVVRKEDTGTGHGVQVNTKAGAQIAHFLRDRLSNIPILVRAMPDHIDNTHFVKNIWLAGSTSKYDVAKEYIDQLAGKAKENCSVTWAQYNAL